MCLVTTIKMTVKHVLHLLQSVPTKPSWHPLGHTPLTWSQGSLFIQCPLHFPLQSIPKYPGKHSVQIRSLLHITNSTHQYHQHESLILYVKDGLMVNLNNQTENRLTCVYTKVLVH